MVFLLHCSFIMLLSPYNIVLVLKLVISSSAIPKMCILTFCQSELKNGLLAMKTYISNFHFHFLFQYKLSLLSLSPNGLCKA